MPYTCDLRYLLGDEESLEFGRLRPGETSLEFSAGAGRSKVDHRKQQALQIVTLAKINASK